MGEGCGKALIAEEKVSKRGRRRGKGGCDNPFQEGKVMNMGCLGDIMQTAGVLGRVSSRVIPRYCHGAGTGAVSTNSITQLPTSASWLEGT
jgi:hypothetical protein